MRTRMTGEHQGNKTPPYVPYKSLVNFLEGIKQGIPSHIDRSLMPSLSGSSSAQIISALKSLGLISEDGLVTELLREMVSAEGQEKQAVWKTILQNSYPYLFEDFDLATAPPSHFEKRFREQGGVSGETVRRCIVFFISAASEAGIPLSSFIKNLAKRRPASTNGTKSKPKKSASRKDDEEFVDGDTYENEVTTDEAIGSAQSANGSNSTLNWRERMEWHQKILEMRLEKLPPFNPEWSPEVQKVWFETLNRLSSTKDLEE